MMKASFQVAILLLAFGGLTLRQDAAQAATPATTAVLGSSDSAVITPVRHYRPYGTYYRPYAGRYSAYRAYRPYVYRPYVAAPYPYPAYGYGYPNSIRSPYYFGYRYPGARARGYVARPRVYPRYGW